MVGLIMNLMEKAAVEFWDCPGCLRAVRKMKSRFPLAEILTWNPPPPRYEAVDITPRLTVEMYYAKDVLHWEYETC
jgi:hypothetical protein